ncbi:SRPBCC family protein [Candidatus Neomarinimicrobiota bacterium]
MLEYNQFVPHPLDDVFAFFEKAENLEQLTPSNLKFKILTPTPINMTVGRLIDYTIKIFGTNFHWRTMITDYNKNENFIDEQLKGPYAFWHHTHSLSKSNGGTQIKDKVIYGLPFGIFGRLAHGLFIRRSLFKIFNYRQDSMNKLFPSVEKLVIK